MRALILMACVVSTSGCATEWPLDWYSHDDPVAVIVEYADGDTACAAVTYASFQRQLRVIVIAVSDGGEPGYYRRVGELTADHDTLRTANVAPSIPRRSNHRECDADDLTDEIEEIIEEDQAAAGTLIVLCDPETAAELSQELPMEIGYRPVRTEWLEAR